MLRRALAVAGVSALVACSGDSGSVEEFCEVARSSQLDATVFAGFDPSDPKRALQQLTDARLALGEYRTAAPGEIRDELDVEIAYVQALIDALSALDNPDPARSVAVVRDVTAQHPGVDDAAADLAAYYEASCT